MTAQEAIQVITDHFCNGCLLTRCEHCAQSMAIKALGKQIPKKVFYKDQHSQFSKEDWTNRDHYNCPMCKRRLRNKQKDDYCPRCGQKLDWGEQE